MGVLTPNMNLNQPTIGVDSGLTWEQQLNANASILDSHNHSVGSGVQIGASGINLASDLPFNGNNAISLRSARFNVQVSPISGALDLGCLYVSGVDLYFNDVNGNQIQMTSGGTVNATSSGISSGTATASFSSSVLVVNSASNTPANIRGASILIGNTGVSGSKYCTLSPPSALASNYSLVLPLIPSSTKIVTIDNAGNIVANYVVDNSTIVVSANVIQVPSQGITATQIANNTITGNQIASNINLPGDAVQVNSKNVTVSNTNGAGVGLAILRGSVNSDGTFASGEGFTCSQSAGTYTVTFSTAFNDAPSVIATVIDTNSGVSVVALIETANTSHFVLNMRAGGAATTSAFYFVCVGLRPS